MNDKASIGILGVGTYLPDQVRSNEWWPREIVEGWTAMRAAAKSPGVGPARTEGAARVMAAMAELESDPFQGAFERRVMAEGMVACDMEVEAAKRALARAAVDPKDIDLLLVHTTVPEYLLTNTACLVHHRLGLPTECFTMMTEGAAASFLMQLTVAEQMILGGRARNALLVQSCSVTRLIDSRDPVSPLFGDGASAVVIGPVASGRGILAAAQRTDGSANRTLIASVRNGRWYDEGPVVLHSADPVSARRVFLETADLGKEVVDTVLGRAGYGPSDVQFFGAHQGAPWFRRVMQAHLGLDKAHSVDSFRSTGYLFAVSIPLGLEAGEREGRLGPGDLVLMYGGGTGLTYGATLLRWGR